MKVQEQPAHADKEEARGPERRGVSGVQVREPVPLDRPDEPIDGLNVVNKQIGPDGLPFKYRYLRSDQQNLLRAQMEGYEIVQDHMPEVTASEEAPMATPRVIGDTVLARIPMTKALAIDKRALEQANGPAAEDAGKAHLESEADKVIRDVLVPRYGAAEVAKQLPHGMVFEEKSS